jgi:hypothetical protein
MTTSRLKFQGTVDVNVPWTDVADIQHAECDVVVSLRDNHRLLRFCCRDADEALRAITIARHRADVAHSAPFETV